MESKIKQSSESKKIYKRLYIVYIAVILIILGIWFYAQYFLNISIVAGNSMYPTYKSEDIVKCRKDFTKSDLKRGDVVVIRYGNEDIIKRIIALPGEHICIRNGQVYLEKEGKYELTGYEFDKIAHSGIIPDKNAAVLGLEEDQYFVMGDNRNQSIDSRDFGPFRFDDIEKIVTGTVRLF